MIFSIYQWDGNCPFFKSKTMEKKRLFYRALDTFLIFENKKQSWQTLSPKWLKSPRKQTAGEEVMELAEGAKPCPYMHQLPRVTVLWLQQGSKEKPRDSMLYLYQRNQLITCSAEHGGRWMQFLPQGCSVSSKCFSSPNLITRNFWGFFAVDMQKLVFSCGCANGTYLYLAHTFSEM